MKTEELRKLLDERRDWDVREVEGIRFRRGDRVLGYVCEEGATTPEIVQETRDGVPYIVTLCGGIIVIDRNVYDMSRIILGE